jgi:hypothetical protein
MVPFNDTDSLEEVAARALSQRSMLTEYLKMNIDNPRSSLVNIGNQGNNVSKLESWFILIQLKGAGTTFEFF